MDCCLTLGNIDRICGGAATPGLTTKIEVICTEKVVSIPAPDTDTHIISTDLVLVTDDSATPENEAGGWYCWNIHRKDSSYTAEPQGDDGDQGWLHTIVFFVPKLTPATSYIMNNTANGDYLVRVTDKCGNKRLIGDLECGGASISVREQTNDKNGYVVTITWLSSYLAYYYTGAVVPAAA